METFIEERHSHSSIISEVNATMAMEDLPLNEHNISTLRSILSGEISYNSALNSAIEYHRLRARSHK